MEVPVMHWVYENGAKVGSMPAHAVGFVYMISYASGRHYIGKKNVVGSTCVPAKLDGTVRKGHVSFTTKRRKMTAKELENRNSNQLRKNVLTTACQYENLKAESKWRGYYGSSKLIPKDDKVIRKTVLLICTNKLSLTYWEMALQVKYDVLGSELFYNENIAGRYFANAPLGVYKPIGT